LAENDIGLVFPAFITDFRDDPSQCVPGFNKLFSEYLEKASFITGKELLAYSLESDPMQLGELSNQFASYIYSCTCTDLLLNSGVRPAMIAGYSMGIYAALYTASAIRFETGLLFIERAYHSILNVLPQTRYGMCGVIGLSEKDIREIAALHNLNLAIVNRNSDYSFVVAGSSFHINVFQLKAKEEGALHTRPMATAIPYHTGLLSEAAKELSETVFSADVQSPVIPVISVLRQDRISDAARVREEVVNNIFNPFNWFETQLKMYQSGIHVFTECGPSQVLLKNSKFMQGSGKFVRWDSLINKFL